MLMNLKKLTSILKQNFPAGSIFSNWPTVSVARHHFCIAHSPRIWSFHIAQLVSILVPRPKMSSSSWSAQISTGLLARHCLTKNIFIFVVVIDTQLYSTAWNMPTLQGCPGAHRVMLLKQKSIIFAVFQPPGIPHSLLPDTAWPIFLFPDFELFTKHFLVFLFHVQKSPPRVNAENTAHSWWFSVVLLPPFMSFPP